ncbi:DgyrCDS13442 [Dimorphilus gyrociliatus]|uniref:DgyrCDS13442 n=1 Tax=Dimorphilus gyrociliatus TaxID=2664684 RepID=A0A7I8WAN5_9ANNE|nr:DgyrCDS13442 [Dimorphilus gyrociliatus]
MHKICNRMYCKVLLFVYLMDLSLTEYVKVETAYGRVTGTRKVVNDFRIETFLGVPYAKPPVGDLRFRRPIPLTQYPPEGINATKLPPTCIQPIDTLFGMHEGVEMWNPNTNISEDCLYMNIWRPWKRKGLLPILIWIYGGTFVSGSCSLDIYDGSVLAEKAQAIVVAMNYRTGPLGFFYLNDRGGEVPGSQGIADQQIVIRYFWNYAKDWGGDRNRITLSGESSGAVSIGLHILSDAVQYVSGVILNSATPLARWGVQSREKALKRAEQLSRKLGCWLENEMDTIKCLRSRPAKDYLDNLYHVQEHYFEPPFGPTIDGSILKRDPREILKSGKFKRIPMIVGNTKDEGMYFFIYGFPEVYKKMNSSSTWDSSDYFFYLRKIIKSVSEKYHKA